MLTENSIIRKQVFTDGLFLRRLFAVTTPEEITTILNGLDADRYHREDVYALIDFLKKIKTQYDTWYETILGLIENFDFNTDRLLKIDFVVSELQIEAGVDNPRQYKTINVAKSHKCRSKNTQYYWEHREELLAKRKEKYRLKSL